MKCRGAILSEIGPHSGYNFFLLKWENPPTPPRATKSALLAPFPAPATKRLLLWRQWGARGSQVPCPQFPVPSSLPTVLVPSGFPSPPLSPPSTEDLKPSAKPPLSSPPLSTPSTEDLKASAKPPLRSKTFDLRRSPP